MTEAIRSRAALVCSVKTGNPVRYGVPGCWFATRVMVWPGEYSGARGTRPSPNPFSIKCNPCRNSHDGLISLVVGIPIEKRQHLYIESELRGLFLQWCFDFDSVSQKCCCDVIPLLAIMWLQLVARDLQMAYRQVSNIRRTLVGNEMVDHSDVVGALPVGAAPPTSSFST